MKTRLLTILLIPALGLGLVLIAGLALTWLARLAPVALAATPIYVRTDGSDTLCNGTANASSISAPNCAFATIQKGVDLIDVNGTVIVVAGTYYENVVITESMTLNALANSIIDGGGVGVVISITNNAAVTIDGFTIIGGDGSANVQNNGDAGGGGIAIRGATAIIRNNLIENNVGSSVITRFGVGGGIQVLSSTMPVRIYNNTIRANVAYSVALTSSTFSKGGAGGGIGIAQAGEAVITHNQIISNIAARTDVPAPDTSLGFGAGVTSLGDSVIIEDNIIQGNLGIAAGLWGWGGGIGIYGTPVVTIANNTIVQNTAIMSGSDAGGGGIYLDVGSGSGQRFTLVDNWVLSNTASVFLAPNTVKKPDVFAGGGGVGIWGGGADNDALTMENNHLLYNVSAISVTNLGTGTVEGGGLSVSRISNTLIISNEISNNTAARHVSTRGAGGWGGGVLGGGMHFFENEDITIQDLRIENNVAVEELLVDGVSSSSEAGGLSLQSFQTAVLRNNWIVGNVAAISASITSNTDENYSASGGIRIDGYDTLNDSLTMENNHIIGNVAARTVTISGVDSQGHPQGGGLLVRDITTTIIISNEVRGNTVVENLSLSGSGGWGGQSSGGGMYLGQNDTVMVSDNEIRDNVTAIQQVVNGVSFDSEAGGIALTNVTNATVRNNTVSGNTAVITGSLTSNTGENYCAVGGGINASCWGKPNCTVSFVDNDILNNIAAQIVTVGGTNADGGAGGGGISIRSGTVLALLQSNLISGNTGNLADGNGFRGGGGVDVDQSTVTMEGNLILGNRSTPSGQGAPAIWIWKGTLTSINDVFAHNTGGIGSGTDGPPARMTIINDTFYDNGDRGIEANDMASTVYVANTIVYSHEDGLRLNNTASTLIGDYNLLSNNHNYDGGVVPVAPGLNDITGQNPLFADAVADNFHLTSNSPAIDKGTSTGAPGVDFEDDSRPQGSGVDIGADEYRLSDVYLPLILKNTSS